MVTKYDKFIAALVLAALSTVAAANGHFSQVLLVNVVLAVLGAVTVFWGPNIPGVGPLAGGQTKLILAAMIALATLLATDIGVHGDIRAVTSAEWTQVVFAVLQALGAGIVPNAPVKAVPVTGGAITP